MPAILYPDYERVGVKKKKKSIKNGNVLFNKLSHLTDYLLLPYIDTVKNSFSEVNQYKSNFILKNIIWLYFLTSTDTVSTKFKLNSI